jgi:hypothetical protein
MLFIDANQLLDLYRMKDGHKLLGPLDEQREHVFTTSQIASEVKRRKVEVAATFLLAQFKKLELRSFGVPGHLFGKAKAADLEKRLGELKRGVDEVNAELDRLASELLVQISKSEDVVSKTLNRLLRNLRKPTAKELERAQRRKELGQPPGKKGDPLGDQLSWEQLLSHCEEKKHKKVWLLTRDSDYAAEYGGQSFLNAVLHGELRSVGVEEVFAFAKMEEGIRHFVNTTGVKGEKLNKLTPAESEELNKEQEQLLFHRSPILTEKQFIGQHDDLKILCSMIAEQLRLRLRKPPTPDTPPP